VDRRIGRGSDLGRDKKERKLAQLKGAFLTLHFLLIVSLSGLVVSKKTQHSTEHAHEHNMSAITSAYVLFFVRAQCYVVAAVVRTRTIYVDTFPADQWNR
jgi:hypothetical protein